MSWKDNIRFILVEPKEPGNAGSTARAIKNMGFRKLALVKPFRNITTRKEYLRYIKDTEAEWFASNALDVLRNAEIYNNLEDAISDASLVIGTTRRLGRRRGVIYELREGVEKLRMFAEHAPVAILFGREDKGLYNEEIKECGMIITIKTSMNAPSLNISHAVLLLAYELSKADIDNKLIGFPPQRFATHEEIEILLKRIEETLDILGYGSHGERRLKEKMLINMRHLLGRAGLTEWEINMLNGICSRIKETIKR